jgi:hypothetical protein
MWLREILTKVLINKIIGTRSVIFVSRTTLYVKIFPSILGTLTALLQGALHPEGEKKRDQSHLCKQNGGPIKLRFEGILWGTRAGWFYVQVATLMKFNVGKVYTVLCTRLQREQTAILEQFTEFVCGFWVSYETCSVRDSVLCNPWIIFIFLYVRRNI